MSPLTPFDTPQPAAGDAFGADPWQRLHRFLVLGSDGGAYHAGEVTLTREHARPVERCLDEDGPRTVAEIVAVSGGGRAPRHEPALFALAMAAGVDDERTRRVALDALPRVARTGTHLFRFAAFAEQFRGWGRSLRRAVGRWYAGQDVDGLAYQVVSHRERDGVSHRDLLRLAHPASRVSARNPTLPMSIEHERLFEWIVRGTAADGLPRVIEGFDRARRAPTAAAAADLVREYGLPREAVAREHLRSTEVWDALLERMSIAALIGNLGAMTRVGVLTPGSDGTARVLAQLCSEERIRRSRVHPIAVLSGLRRYGAGRRAGGRAEWIPVAEILHALDAAFHTAIPNVKPTGERMLLALDVSASMARGEVAGVPGLTPLEVAAALALITVAREPRCEIAGFFAGAGGIRRSDAGRFAANRDGLSPLTISPGQRLDEVVSSLSNLPFGGTDCALPMRYAQRLDREIDAFVIYTDAETGAADLHPARALRHYRRASNLRARVAVVGMVSGGFSIADPADPQMLDVVGFDAATPQLVSDFVEGVI